VWDDLFNRPVGSFTQSRNKRELTTLATFPYTQLLIDLVGENNRELWRKKREILSGAQTTIKRSIIAPMTPRASTTGTTLAVKPGEFRFPL
jgi:hypothetical protein